MNYIIMLCVPCNFLDSARVVFHDMEVAWQWSFTIVAAIGSCCLVEEFIIIRGVPRGVFRGFRKPLWILHST